MLRINLHGRLLGKHKFTLHRSILTVSVTKGPTEPPLSNSTLPEYFSNTILEKHASRPALIAKQEIPRPFGGPTKSTESRHLAWDFEEFDRHVRALSAGLSDLGVVKGERVGVIMGNCSAYAMLQWACARIGAILVTLNPAYHINEIMTTLKLTGVSRLFVVPRLRSSLYLQALSSAIPSLQSPSGLSSSEAIGGDSLPDLRSLMVVNNMKISQEFSKEMENVPAAIDFREMLRWGENAKADAVEALYSNDVINIQFTSGTTGYPKGVSLTHSNLLNNGLSIGRCMNLTSEDKLCNVPPLFHCFDRSFRNLAAWVHGAAILYPSETFDPAAIVDALHQDQCTALHGVPTHFLGVLAEVERRRRANEEVDLSRLRTGIAAGSSIPIHLMKRLIDEMNLTDLTIAYGMTETSPVSFQTTISDSLTQRVETVGKVAPHVEAKITNPASGSMDPVLIGVPGELCVSGYLLQKGYWNDKRQTEDVMKYHDEKDHQLWIHTGDVGILDEDGYLRIVGRIKDVIIRGGENLFPVQIENRLSTHPSILESAIVAVPDEKYGEVVGAWIVLKPESNSPDKTTATLSPQVIKDWVISGMNPQNSPAWVWFCGKDGVQSELPKTASGKVQKHILREWSREYAGRGFGKVV